MDIKKTLPFLGKFVVWVSPKRVLMAAFMAFVVILSLTLFEQRGALSNAFEEQDLQQAPVESIIELSAESRRKVDAFVVRSPSVVGVAVSSGNLKVNQRTTLYHFIDDPVLQVMWADMVKTRGLTQPIFSADHQNNTQMVGAINGDFVCSKFEDTPIGKLVPKMNERVSYACRISLPPYYGNFIGFVTVMTIGPMTDDLQNEIRIDTVRLANDIYRELVSRR